MSKFGQMLAVLVQLASVARRFVVNGVPVASTDGNNDWTATKISMETYLRRPLRDEEITLLSISRGFGPTPLLQEWNVIRRLWPNKNVQGSRYDWDQLVEELFRFQDGNDNAVFVHPSGLHGVYIVELCEDPGRGHLSEETSDTAQFGDQYLAGSQDMTCLGWFGPGERWVDAEQGIRTLAGYPIDPRLVGDIAVFQRLWDQGRMDEAEAAYAANWHPDAFAAQLWRGVTPRDARGRAIAALIKLQAVLADLPACVEQNQVRAALDALTGIGTNPTEAS